MVVVRIQVLLLVGILVHWIHLSVIYVPFSWTQELL